MANLARRRVLTSIVLVLGLAGAIGISMPFVLGLLPGAGTKHVVDIQLEEVPEGSYIEFVLDGKPLVIYRPGGNDLDYLIGLNSRVSGPKYEPGDIPDFFTYFPLSTYGGCRLKDAAETYHFPGEQGWWDPCHQGFWDFTGRHVPGLHQGQRAILPNLVNYSNYTVMEGGLIRFE